MYKKIFNKGNIINFIGINYIVYINYNFYRLIKTDKLKQIN